MARRKPNRPDPFATVAMAEIYLDQGRLKKALSTAKAVLKRDPGDLRAADLVSFLEPLSGDEAPSFRSTHEPGLAVAGVRLSLDASDQASLAWNLDSETLSVSRSRAGAGSRMAARLFWISKGTRGPTRHTRDYLIEEEQGFLSLGPLPRTRRYGAAIGWLSPRGSFTAAAHAFMEDDQ